jgi:putative Ca2+/H+ antiporter (TMEM165/GDT1 family)
MQEFVKSLFTVFLAELGDKTQLVALSLATQYSTSLTLAGILCATLVIHIISVALGGAAGSVLPTDWINLLAGVAFVGFGFWTLRGDSLDDDEDSKRHSLSPFWTVFVTFFLAELGDKTMLSTIALAATTTVSLLPIVLVWLGSSIGMVFSDGLAIIVGKVLGSRLPEKAIKVGASIIFFGFGIVKGYEGALRLPVYSWLLAVVLTAGMTWWFFKEKSKLAADSASDKDNDLEKAG